MKKVTQLVYLLFVSALLAACSGGSSEVAPRTEIPAAAPAARESIGNATGTLDLTLASGSVTLNVQ